MPIEICKKEDCTGCLACMNICPKDAISCGLDEYDKTVPVIDQEKCVECGMCRRVCPVCMSGNFRQPEECYAAWAKDEEERKECSSGGIATELSKAVIRDGGIVYGAAFDEELTLCHKAARTEKDLQALKGSKYVQSYVGFSYREIKELLKKGKKVLFLGTPCQVAGLRSYLGREEKNLLMIDLICHGTPPVEYLKAHVKSIDREERASDLTFRGKYNFFLTLYEKGKVFYSEKSEKDYYFLGFLKGLIYRDNCYTCRYATQKRCSDITIGDFWGLDRSTLAHPYEGRISTVLINTENGKAAWEKYRELFICEKRNVQESVEGNAQLRKPSICHPDREQFRTVYRATKSFEKAVRTSGMKKEIRKNRIKDIYCIRLLRKLKMRLKKIKR